MSQPVRRRSNPTHYTQMNASQRTLPPWIAPLGAVVVLLVIVAVALSCCQGCQQQPEQAPEPAVEEGVRTSEEAVAAGGVAADGSSNVQTSFAAYSWDELGQIAQEIAGSGSKDAALALAQKYRLVNEEGKLTGDCKPLNWSDGTAGAVQIAGFFHDDKSDGSGKAGITFITRDSLPQPQCMNASATNYGGWEFSDLRASILESGMDQFPSDVSGKIVAVEKATNNVGLTDYEGVVTSTSDALWLYSKTELCGTVTYPTPTPLYNSILESEGVQYQLFSDASVADKAQSPLLLKSNGDNACVWWTRSPMPDVNTGNGYFVVLKSGVTDDFAYYPDNDYGIVLGFCF